MGFPILKALLGRKRGTKKRGTGGTIPPTNPNSEAPDDFTVDEVRKDYGVELDESQM
jgi:hypothetical protein